MVLLNSLYTRVYFYYLQSYTDEKCLPMKFLPSITEEYTSSMTPVELADRLGQFVEPRRYWTRSLFRDERSKTFEGEVSETGFSIKPIIRYRNSFIPIMKGTVKPTETGSKIKLEMTLHPFVKSFMRMWLGMVAMGFITITISMLESSSFSPLFLFPIGMWFFGYFLAKKGFGYEAKPAQTTLESIIKMSAEESESK